MLAACSSGPEAPEICVRGDTSCTPAPKKATSRPYQIQGVWYHPQPHFEYEETGIASYYGGGDTFHGRPTATGKTFDMNGITAAHKTLPLPCVVEVTNLDNGRQLQVEVNDRGPFIEGRIIDVSRRVAQLLGFEGKGTSKVRVRTLVPESLALNNMDPSTVMVAQASPALPEMVVPVEIAALPRLPESLFEEQQEVLVLAEAPPPLVAKPEPSPSTGIFVDVGGYENHEEAHALSQSLNGVTDSPVQPVKNKGPKPYAARLGPLVSLSHANQVLDQLASAGHLMSRIVIHR